MTSAEPVMTLLDDGNAINKGALLYGNFRPATAQADNDTILAEGALGFIVALWGSLSGMCGHWLGVVTLLGLLVVMWVQRRQHGFVGISG